MIEYETVLNTNIPLPCSIGNILQPSKDHMVMYTILFKLNSKAPPTKDTNYSLKIKECSNVKN